MALVPRCDICGNVKNRDELLLLYFFSPTDPNPDHNPMCITNLQGKSQHSNPYNYILFNAFDCELDICRNCLDECGITVMSTHQISAKAFQLLIRRALSTLVSEGRKERLSSEYPDEDVVFEDQDDEGNDVELVYRTRERREYI